MKFGIGGREYSYDGVMTVEDAMFVFDKSGVGVTGLNDAIFLAGNPHAIAAWLYLMKRRAGEAVRWEQMLKLDINTYRVIHDKPSADTTGDADDSDNSGEKAADPTSRSGKTRRRATTAT